MESYDQKIVPDLLRWIKEKPKNQRTVIVRIAYSQPPEDAEEIIKSKGMVPQSCGPSMIVAAADCESVKRVAALSCVKSIDVPKRLGLKE